MSRSHYVRFSRFYWHFGILNRKNRLLIKLFCFSSDFDGWWNGLAKCFQMWHILGIRRPGHSIGKNKVAWTDKWKKYTFSTLERPKITDIHLLLLHHQMHYVQFSLFCFYSSNFYETWWSCSTHCVLQFQQVSWKSDEKQKSFINSPFNGYVIH